MEDLASPSLPEVQESVGVSGVPPPSPLLMRNSSTKTLTPLHSTPRKGSKRGAIGKKCSQQRALQGFLVSEPSLQFRQNGIESLFAQDPRALMSFALPIHGDHPFNLVSSLSHPLSPGFDSATGAMFLSPIEGETSPFLPENFQGYPSPLLTSTASTSGDSPLPRLNLDKTHLGGGMTSQPLTPSSSSSSHVTFSNAFSASSSSRECFSGILSPPTYPLEAPHMAPPTTGTPPYVPPGPPPSWPATPSQRPDEGVTAVPADATSLPSSATQHPETPEAANPALSTPPSSKPTSSGDTAPGKEKADFDQTQPRFEYPEEKERVRRAPPLQKEAEDTASASSECQQWSPASSEGCDIIKTAAQQEISSNTRERLVQRETGNRHQGEDARSAAPRWQSPESVMWPAGASSTEEDTECESRKGARGGRVTKEGSRRGLRLGGGRRKINSQNKRELGSTPKRSKQSHAFKSETPVRETTKGGGRQSEDWVTLEAVLAEPIPAGENKETVGTEQPEAGVAHMHDPESMAVLRCRPVCVDGDDCVVFLVAMGLPTQGESCEEVRKVVRLVRPDVVFLELCPERVASLVPNQHFKEMSTLAQALGAVWEGQASALGALHGYLLAREAGGEELIMPGAELRAAYEEAAECGAVVKLGDRPTQISLRRLWGNLGVWQKIVLSARMVGRMFRCPSKEASVEGGRQLVDMPMLGVEDLEDLFPMMTETLTHERHLFMTAMLRHVAQRSTAVVAVVSQDSMKGIEENWEKEDINVKALLAVTPTSATLLSPAFTRWATATLLVSATVAIVCMKYYRKPT